MPGRAGGGTGLNTPQQTVTSGQMMMRNKLRPTPIFWIHYLPAESRNSGDISSSGTSSLPSSMRVMPVRMMSQSKGLALPN
eukprot:scaffold11290_cov125-Isochrysis_galbana.AAC.3